MERQFPKGMNEKCKACPTAQLCLDMIEVRDAAAAESLGRQLDSVERLDSKTVYDPDGIGIAPKALIDATEQFLKSSDRVIGSAQTSGETQRSTLVRTTEHCKGPTKKLFGKIACSQDIFGQYSMLPLTTMPWAADDDFPAAQAIRAKAEKLAREDT